MPSLSPFLKRYLAASINYQKQFTVLIIIVSVVLLILALTQPQKSSESSLVFNLTQAKQGQLKLSALSPLMQVKTHLALLIFNLAGQDEERYFLLSRLLFAGFAVLTLAASFYLALALFPQKPQVAVLAFVALAFNAYFLNNALDFSGQMLLVVLAISTFYLSLEIINSKQPFINLTLALVLLFLFNQLTYLAVLINLPLLIGALMSRFYLDFSDRLKVLEKYKLLVIFGLPLFVLSLTATIATYLKLSSHKIALIEGFKQLITVASTTYLPEGFLNYTSTINRLISYLFIFFILSGSVVLLSDLLKAKKVNKQFLSQVMLICFLLLTLVYQLFYDPNAVAAIGLVPLFIMGTTSVFWLESSWLLVVTAEVALFLLQFLF